MPTVLGVDELWLVWLVYVVGFASALTIEFALLPSARAVELRLDYPKVLPLGHTAKFTLTGRASRPVRCHVEIETEGEIESGSDDGKLPVIELLLGGGDDSGEDAGQVVAELPVTPERRGQLHILMLHARWPGPLGLLWHESTQAVDGTMNVVVDVAAVRGRVSRMVENREFQLGLKVERYAGDGTEFDSIREFVQGMDHRSIDWKSTARHRALRSREYRAERAQSMMVCIDSGRLMGEPLAGTPRLDRAIQAALELAFVSLRTGDRVGVYSFADQPQRALMPLAGVHAMHAIQEQLVALDYSDQETNFTLGMTQLLQQLRRRTLLVLFTDFLDSVTAELMLRNLGWLARKHLLLFVALRDPLLDNLVNETPTVLEDVHRAVVADEITTERRLVLQRIRESGAQVLDVDVHELGPALITRYLAMKRREML
ncbi:MAG: hypothetical protein ACI8UD_001889 [Planctomycetota bacterium]|jgi:uncharacterized protein (DUF58 family)